MANPFQTKGKEASEGTPSKWIKAPAVVIANIVDVSFGSASTGSEYLDMVHMTDEEIPGLQHEHGSGQIASTRMYLTTNAMPYTMDNLMLISDYLGFRDELDKVTDGMTESTTNEQFVAAIKPLFLGRKGAWLIGAEQRWMKNMVDDEWDGTYVEFMAPRLHTRVSFVKPVARIAEIEELMNKQGEEAFINYNEKPQEDPVGDTGLGSDTDW